MCDCLAGDPDVMYVEMVEGLGNTLVGNSPGSAFRFSVRKDSLAAITVEGLSSKSEALVSDAADPGLIFRSDSNGEDLEGYVLPPMSAPYSCTITVSAGDESLVELNARHGSLPMLC